jgi:hypothetical protein
MRSPDWCSLVVTRTLSVPLSKSNSLATMDLTILFPEKVGRSIIQERRTDDANIGLGFIMLLSGKPGIGKSLTAESG